jgi:hypothetical protein
MRRVRPELVVALFALLGAVDAHADGGVVIATGPAGPFEVIVLVSPPQLRAGPSEWSVLVRNPADGGVVLDAEVEIRLQPPDPRGFAHPQDASDSRAVRSASANRLLHTAWIELASPGTWRARVRVHDGAGTGELSFEVPVAPAAAAIVQHWDAFALPPLGLALFALHQYLVRRRSPARRQAA